MSRYFAPISEADLAAKINKAFDDRGHLSFQDMVDKLGKDLKVSFDLENYESSGSGPILGYHTLPNGLTFLGCQAGGDWEYPVTFIVYWDGKKIRGYVPMEGNPWNTTTKQAYGNDEDADGKNAHKRWPDKFDGSPLDDSGCFDADDDEILKDIQARILPTPKGLPVNNKAVITAHAGKVKKTLEEKVKALEYYGDCDEGTELFEQTLGLCYSMYGLGETDHAETLYEWAKEQAQASKEFAEEQAQDSGDMGNIIKGCWGH